MGRTLGWGREVGRTLVGRWRWGGPWWGGGGGADPGGEVEVGAGVTRGGVGLSLIPTPRYPHPPVETNH